MFGEVLFFILMKVAFIQPNQRSHLCASHDEEYINLSLRFKPTSGSGDTLRTAFEGSHRGNEVALVTEHHFTPNPGNWSSPGPLHLQCGWLISKQAACIMAHHHTGSWNIQPPIFSDRLISRLLQSHSQRCLWSVLFPHPGASCQTGLDVWGEMQRLVYSYGSFVAPTLINI